MHCITEINFCHFNLEFRLPAWSLTSPTWESLPLRNRRSWWILHTQTLDLDTLHFCFSSEREMDSVSLVGEKEITYFILIENLTLMTILLHKSSNISSYIICYTYKESPRGAASGMSRCHFLGDFSCLSWASIMCNQAEILICWSLTQGGSDGSGRHSAAPMLTAIMSGGVGISGRELSLSCWVEQI